MLERLLAHPGVEERCELRGRFGFMAYHGGNLERVTDEIAAAAAERCDASLYAVVQPSHLRWHLPSTEFRADRSEVLASFLDHVDAVITIHGYGREGFWTSVLVGGQNRSMARYVGEHLRAGLPDYDIVDDLAAIPGALRGQHPDNPVNVPRDGGVQIELPPRIRGMSRHWGVPHWGRVPHTEDLIEALAAAATDWQPVERA